MADAPANTKNPAGLIPAEKPVERYMLASAARRAIAGFLDLLLMTLVAIGIGTLFVYNQLYVDRGLSFYEVMRSFFVRDSASATILETLDLDYWRLVGFGFCTLLAYLTYFTIIPMFTRGRTLFCWLFFIRKVELKNASLFFWHLLLRDMFVWIAPVTLGVIVVLATPSGNLGRLFSYFSFSSKYSTDAASIVIKSLYAVELLIALIQVVHMFVKDRKLSLSDMYSRTAIIYERDQVTVKPDPLVKKQVDAFPGMGVPVAAAT